ncbi:hypothetical protein JR338_12005 [Chloroflexota bacterium]|nr:hypothetical protein JR338_12005 [Chloroflexota bacterium]
MTETSIKTEKMKAIRPKLRIGLLALQILLPLAGYFALQEGHLGLTWGIAGIFIVSMAVLIWLG